MEIHALKAWRPATAAAPARGMAEVEAGAATKLAGRRSKLRSKPRSGRILRAEQLKEQVREDRVQHVLQHKHASRPEKRPVRRRKLMQKMLAQARKVHKKMPSRNPPNKHAQRSSKKRKLVNQALAR